ncbi:MAG: hypothetical protein QM606_03800, partial [Leucobacter sp.]
MAASAAGAGELQRARSGLLDHQAAQVPLAHGELGSEAGDALRVDGSVPDAAHGARHEIAANVPIARAGHRVGPA